MKNKLNKILYSGAAFVLVPAVTFAAGKDLSYLIRKITGYLQAFLVLMMGVAVVMFTFYIIKYFIRPDADRKEAGNYVLYSVLGFFVILSFWGLVNILQNTFELKNENNRRSTWDSFTNLFPGSSSNNNQQNIPDPYGGSNSITI